MINNFQKSLSLNKECIWEIIKIFHPDILEEYDNKYKEGKIITKDKLKVYTKYDWVCIELFLQTHIRISLSIEFECHLMSGYKPLNLFEKELKNNKFKCWRIVDDSKFKLEDKDEYKYLKILYNNILNDVLIKYNIEKPTAKQMSDYYHSD